MELLNLKFMVGGVMDGEFICSRKCEENVEYSFDENPPELCTCFEMKRGLYKTSPKSLMRSCNK